MREMRIVYDTNDKGSSIELYPENEREYSILEKLGYKDFARVGYNVQGYWMTPDLKRWSESMGIESRKYQVYNEIGGILISPEDERIVLIHIEGDEKYK